MIIIDGSTGEGGGQVLRTSLGLSLVTGRPFRIENIRARRSKPGLMRQHLSAVRAAAQISDANVTGDAIGSRELRLEPGPVRPGQYEFAVGTAGSATLVLQTVLPALVIADGPLRNTYETTRACQSGRATRRSHEDLMEPVARFEPRLVKIAPADERPED